MGIKAPYPPSPYPPKGPDELRKVSVISSLAKLATRSFEGPKFQIFNDLIFEAIELSNLKTLRLSNFLGLTPSNSKILNFLTRAWEMLCQPTWFSTCPPLPVPRTGHVAAA